MPGTALSHGFLMAGADTMEASSSESSMLDFLIVLGVTGLTAFMAGVLMLCSRLGRSRK